MSLKLVGFNGSRIPIAKLSEAKDGDVFKFFGAINAILKKTRVKIKPMYDPTMDAEEMTSNFSELSFFGCPYFQWFQEQDVYVGIGDTNIKEIMPNSPFNVLPLIILTPIK